MKSGHRCSETYTACKETEKDCFYQLKNNISKALLLFPDKNSFILFSSLIDNVQRYRKFK